MLKFLNGEIYVTHRWWVCCCVSGHVVCVFGWVCAREWMSSDICLNAFTCILYCCIFLVLFVVVFTVLFGKIDVVFPADRHCVSLCCTCRFPVLLSVWMCFHICLSVLVCILTVVFFLFRFLFVFLFYLAKLIVLFSTVCCCISLCWAHAVWGFVCHSAPRFPCLRSRALINRYCSVWFCCFWFRCCSIVWIDRPAFSPTVSTIFPPSLKCVCQSNFDVVLRVGVVACFITSISSSLPPKNRHIPLSVHLCLPIPLARYLFPPRACSDHSRVTHTFITLPHTTHALTHYLYINCSLTHHPDTTHVLANLSHVTHIPFM